MKTRTRALVPVTQPLIGEERAVANALAAAERRGELVAATRQARLGDWRVVYDVTLLQRPARAASTGRRWNASVVATYAVVGVGVVGAAVAAVVAFVAWVMAHLALILGVGLVVAILFGRLAASGKCPGLHCPGCDG